MTRSEGLKWARLCNLKIFLVTERMKDKLDHFTPCACVRGKYITMCSMLVFALGRICTCAL